MVGFCHGGNVLGNHDDDGDDADDNYPMVIKELAQLPNIASFCGRMIINL